MIYGIHFLLSVVFGASVVRNMSHVRPLPSPSITISHLFSITLSFWIIGIVAVANSNAPSLSMAHNYPLTGDSIDTLRSGWNLQKQSSALARGLQLDSRNLNQVFIGNNSRERSISTEELPTTGPDSINTNDDLDESKNDNTNDDITVVVPLNFARGETIDDEVFAENEQPLSVSSGDSQVSNRRISWIYGAALVLVFSIAGFLIYRKRERNRRREYRTHRILQEHVEAFDLSFGDEDDDVELSNF